MWRRCICIHLQPQATRIGLPETQLMFSKIVQCPAACKMNFCSKVAVVQVLICAVYRKHLVGKRDGGLQKHVTGNILQDTMRLQTNLLQHRSCDKVHTQACCLHTLPAIEPHCSMEYRGYKDCHKHVADSERKGSVTTGMSTSTGSMTQVPISDNDGIPGVVPPYLVGHLAAIARSFPYPDRM